MSIVNIHCILLPCTECCNNCPLSLTLQVNTTNKILYISDIHWDPQYTPGLQARCDEPLCCRPPLPKGIHDGIT